MSRRNVVLITSAMGDLRVYSLSHALKFNTQFDHCRTFTGDQFLVTVFSFESSTLALPVLLGFWA